jgi:soluble lytic murein transglycosylase-like protein
VFDSRQKRREVVLLLVGTVTLGLWVFGPENEHEPPPLLWEDTAPPETIQEPAEDFAQHCDIEPPPGFDRMVKAAGEATGINPRLIALTVYRESRCKVNALGAVGEIGMGQVYPRIWEETLVNEGVIKSVDDLYDPEVNLRATGFILGEALRYAKGDPVDALRRYNGSGPAAERYAHEQSNLYQAMWGEPAWFRNR